MTRLQKIRRLRIAMSVFFLGVVGSLGLMIYFGYQQFIYESYFQYRWKASNALVQINKHIKDHLDTEEQRSPEEYGFYQPTKNPVTGDVTFEVSPLAASVDAANHPLGLLGHFQINANGQFESPLLPLQWQDNANESLPLNSEQIQLRQNAIVTLRALLIDNGFLQAVSLGHGSIESESRWVNANELSRDTSSFDQHTTPDGHIIFHRMAWNNGLVQQGFVVSNELFLFNLIAEFVNLGRFDGLVEARLMNVVEPELAATRYFTYDINDADVSSVEINTSPHSKKDWMRIYFGQLVAPFDQYELRFTTANLPLGPGSEFVFLFLCLLLFVVLAGCVVFYRSGVHHINLAEERMNFASSVSHELKTPLTSILMYSEMLKSDMIDDNQVTKQYHEFIHDESQRLSRLINNVLLLSKVKQTQDLSLEATTVRTLIDLIHSKLGSLLEQHHFKLHIDDAHLGEQALMVNRDAFIQIMINLVDNAIKFYRALEINDPDREKVDIVFSDGKGHTIKMMVRDYGGGLPQSKLKKIFQLFYRDGNELTRTTSGTGIGLALVKTLVKAQQGHIEVKKQNPGLAFHLYFKQPDSEKDHEHPNS